MPKQPLDDRKSTHWSIAFLSSVGVGYRKIGGAVVIFDLVNLETGRAHRLTWTGMGKKGGALPFGGAFRDTGYNDFKTKRPANFPDFDDKIVELKVKDRLVHSSRTIEFPDGNRELAEVRVSGWGPSIPGSIKGRGSTEIHYSDGKPVGIPQLLPKVDLKSKEDLSTKWDWKARESAIAITLPSEFMFDFDSDKIKDESEAILDQVIALINAKNVNKEFKRIVVEGHTDSKERVPGYNMDLSRRRAQNVMKYLRDNTENLERYKLETKWYGATRPDKKETMIMGLDNPIARAKNRRVEIILER